MKDNPKLIDVIREWQTSPRYVSKTPNTQRAYGAAVKKLAKLKDIPIRDIQNRQLVEVLEKTEGTSAQYILKCVMNQIWTRAVLMQYADGMPVLPSINCTTTPILKWEREQLEEIIESARGTKVGDAMLIGYHTALRIGDILNLEWSMYDGESINIITQKTKQHMRIPVSSTLKFWLDTQKRECRYIIHRNGVKMDFPYFNSMYRRMLPITQYPTFHGIRHAAATRLAELGASPHQIMAVTGHKSLKQVMRYTQGVDNYKAVKELVRGF